MTEIVIISGKGGTGKTSITAAFATLANRPVLVDCDVDAADLHLLLHPAVRETHEFWGGRIARIAREACVNCGLCSEMCRFDAIVLCRGASDPIRWAEWEVDPIACEGCGVCVRFCPQQAIVFEETLAGHWFLSDTRVGPMIHARLAPAKENSGKLVTLIRQKARTVASDMGRDLILVDGPPGIGCPVIASLTGADQVVVVTEPTAAGFHDLQRALELAAHFGAPVSLIVNKCDLNSAVSREIADYARKHQARVICEIPYDPVITQAQLAQQSVVEYSDGHVTRAIQDAWMRLNEGWTEIEGGHLVQLEAAL